MPDTTSIGKLVQAFAKHIKTFKSNQTNEAEIRQTFIDPFWRALGWDVGDLKKRVGPSLAEVIIKMNVETAEADGGVRLSDGQRRRHESSIDANEKRIDEAVFSLYGVDGLPESAEVKKQ